ncbi:anaerobic nitric oxide reductase flavorubredoxin [Photobacterium damselae subsp. piscicida]|uniref:Anaerobic nitric oxide reductase flavorubredoxin n=1 Tax=Photobacterium damsela subsp. piscicida TaxID=38294 RepID=A0AAD1CGC3_PHODP|nr:Anaerobic nitric oxide reductase flavorubredoxin [Photobacterium damselae subsp. piscicida]BBC39393.1 anaerobic nitric oxide reductase flavorubredoxin [Photobacterium damselae subsp. piscicida]GAW42945.1 Anaerobic nitric oxide reductase flavorubredoxin [Photobacterium damselae subsp. piscicida]
MAIQVKNNIQWVGQRDWEVRDFHGTEYKTTKGTSYNSYLIREKKQYLLILLITNLVMLSYKT